MSAQGFHRLSEQADLIITQARTNYAEFLRTQQLSLDLIKSALLLAKLDPFARRGQIDENLNGVEERDIEDLRNIMALVDANLFRTTGGVWLNPTFGEASFLVGGADADLVVDDLIVEIKTLRDLKLKRDDFNQLIGYYCLSKIGSLNGSGEEIEISQIGIYYSRHSYLHVINMSEVVNPLTWTPFLEWFQERAARNNY